MQGLLALGEMIKANTTLHKLSLQNQRKEFSTKIVAEFAEMLDQNHMIVKLGLRTKVLSIVSTQHLRHEPVPFHEHTDRV
jgi:hypothetical protein